MDCGMEFVWVKNAAFLRYEGHQTGSGDLYDQALDNSRIKVVRAIWMQTKKGRIW